MATIAEISLSKAQHLTSLPARLVPARNGHYQETVTNGDPTVTKRDHFTEPVQGVLENTGSNAKGKE